MPLESQFSAGPRLTDVPGGDPATRAVASLRGYAYQLYVSGLAWLNVRADQYLYLEVAKDYAIVAADALRAIEVKDTPFASITINSEDVRDTLDHFVDLVERNPKRRVDLRFLCTAVVAEERRREDRVNGMATLAYWRQAALGADVAPLRQVLSNARLAPRVRAFIDARNDEILRDEFLRRIHWDCGRPPLDDVADELERGLIRYGAERLNSPAADKDRLTAAVLRHILTTIVQVEAPLRRLADTDLLQILNNVTHVSLPRQDFDALMRATSGRFGEDQPAGRLEPTTLPTILEPEYQLPLTLILAERTSLIADVLRKAQSNGVAVITGSTGCGKTVLARMTAKSQGGAWYLLDARDAKVEEIIQRVELALGSLGISSPAGIIVDDFNEIEEPASRRALFRFMQALRRRDALCIVTAYREPSSRAFSNSALIFPCISRFLT